MALTDNLISYYKFDESSGNAADSVGSNTLTNTNTVTYSTGKINNGAYFSSASNQYFTISDASQTGLDIASSFTFSLWYYLTDIVASYRGILTKANSADTSVVYNLQVYPNATDPQFICHLSSSGSYGPYTTITATGQGTGAWHMLTLTYDASTQTPTWYFDGVSQGTGTISGTLPSTLANTTDAVRIGSNASDAAFNGRMDEFGIWSRALSNIEVAQLYNNTSGLQYSFTLPTTSILPDATSSHNGFGASATTYTQAHTCTGTNGVLVAGLILRGIDENATATYNGVSMTAQTRIYNTNTCIQTFTLANPASGTNNIVFTWTTAGSFYSIACSYTGAKQTGQPDSSAQAQADSTTITGSTTVVDENCWLVGVYADDWGSSAATKGANTVIREAINDTHGSFNFIDSGTQVASGSRSLIMNQSGGSTNLVMGLVSISPATTSTVNSAFFGFM